MSEDTLANFSREGQPAFPTETGEETPADSQPEKETETEPTQSDEGGNTQTKDNDVPFHKHPRWIEREEAWNKRFNEQETRHQDDMKKIREEFGQPNRKEGQESSVPEWFGGSEEQFSKFLSFVEERALRRVTETTEQEKKLQQEATEHFESELAAIEADEALNPTGEKIDPNKLLKIVLDNELIDSKGRWNYRAAYRIYRAENTQTPPPKDTKERKNLASATTSESKAEPKQKTYMTSSDFKGANRPW